MRTYPKPFCAVFKNGSDTTRGNGYRLFLIFLKLNKIIRFEV